MEIRDHNGTKMMAFSVPEIGELQFGLCGRGLEFRSHTLFRQGMEALTTEHGSDYNLDFLPVDTVLEVPFDAVHVAAAVASLEEARDDRMHNASGAVPGTISNARGKTIYAITNAALDDICEAVGGAEQLQSQINAAKAVIAASSV